METIQIKGREFEMTTLTKVDMAISSELVELLKCEYDYEFTDLFDNMYSNNLIKNLLEDNEELERVIREYNLVDEDIEDLQCIAELLTKVDFVQLERAL